jgi:hypothetical protein
LDFGVILYTSGILGWAGWIGLYLAETAISPVFFHRLLFCQGLDIGSRLSADAEILLFVLGLAGSGKLSIIY